MDSPGFSAQYCTYTAMDNSSKQILNMVNIDKRQTMKNSAAMEKEGFIRTVETLRNELDVVEFCTDTHMQISALFSTAKFSTKKSRKWSLYVIKEDKDYAYIRDLQSAIIEKKRLSSAVPRKCKKRPDDPRQYGVLSGIPAPFTGELLDTLVSSRGLGLWAFPDTLHTHTRREQQLWMVGLVEPLLMSEASNQTPGRDHGVEYP
ncbi:hypothetical protein F2P79_016715 [Pimephales promelas]|nr:hypothetical protein F2P79_016715 [Pimephales promelas]